MILKKRYLPTKDDKWHRKFLWWPTWVQSLEEFHGCRAGDSLLWLETVWRQNISATDIKIYRYVRSEIHPQAHK